MEKVEQAKNAASSKMEEMKQSIGEKANQTIDAVKEATK